VLTEHISVICHAEGAAGAGGAGGAGGTDQTGGAGGAGAGGASGMGGAAGGSGPGGGSGTGGSGGIDTLEMPHELPEPREVEGTAVIVGGDDTAQSRAAIASIRVRYSHTSMGGKLLFSSSLDGTPTGDLWPDGMGGGTWDDQQKNNYQDGMTVKDSDVMSNISVVGDVLHVTCTRTDFDGTTWPRDLEITLTEGAGDWFAGLQAPAPTDVTATLSGTLSGTSVTVSAEVQGAAGEVVEFLAADGQRRKVRVGADGKVSASFSEVWLSSSGKIVVSLVYGAHTLGSIELK
jgi:hypothetical protein